MRNKNLISVILSVIASFSFVVLAVNASTTISTDITTGGALTVTGVSTFNGTLYASNTATFDSAKITDGKGLTLGSSGSNPTTAVEGMIYYDSTNRAIKLYDGTQWFTVGTTTNGVTLSGNKVQLSDYTTQYITFGTTTQSGFSVLTLGATTTASIPLTIKAVTSQSANLLQIYDSANTELFAIDKVGNASTSQITTNGTLWVNGFATTTGSNGNFATQGSVGVASSTPYVALGVTGTTTSSTGMVIGAFGTPMYQVLSGTCTITPQIGTLADGSATTTTCTATGVVGGEKTFITPANLPKYLYLNSASSTAANTIQISIGAATTTTISAATSYSGWSWMAIR